MADFTTLAGAFKVKYQEGKLDNNDFRLNVCPLLDSVPFRKPATGIAVEMDIPVALTQHNGNTFQAAGASGSLTTAVPAVVQMAKVTNQEIAGYLDVSFGVLEALSNDAVSYLNPQSLKVFELEKSVRRDQEITHLHGGSSDGIGAIASAGGAVQVSGALYSVSVVLTAKTWAGGIWKFNEGMTVDIIQSAAVGNAAALTVHSVTPSTKTIVLYGTQSDCGLPASLGYLVRRGAFGNEGIGLKKMFSATSGTLFNIDQGLYTAWRASQIDVNSQPISFVKLASGVAEAVSGALEGELEVQTSPKSFANLMTDQAGLRRYAAKPAAFENGAEGVAFYSEAGKIAVVSNPFMMEGDTLGYPKDSLLRIGTTEPTDVVAGVRLDVVSTTGTSVRMYFFAAEQIFCRKMAAALYWKNIVPNS